MLLFETVPTPPEIHIEYVARISSNSSNPQDIHIEHAARIPSSHISDIIITSNSANLLQIIILSMWSKSPPDNDIEHLHIWREFPPDIHIEHVAKISSSYPF